MEKITEDCFTTQLSALEVVSKMKAEWFEELFGEVRDAREESEMGNQSRTSAAWIWAP